VYDESINGDPLHVVLLTGADLTTVHDQPSPEGSEDDLATTVSIPPEATTTQPGDTTTTTTVPTTTTTVIGYSTGEPPDGVDCS
jgi:hypothetical protein